MMTDDEYHAEFELVWPWLEKAANDDFQTETQETLWKKIAKGQLQLWTSESSAVVSSIEIYGSGTKEVRIWLAGGDLQEIRKIEPAIVEFARINACRHVSVIGRRGWAKVLQGYKDSAVILVKDVSHGL
jgi:hypothetical protein